MELTKEALQAWRSNPITAEITRRVKLKVKEEQSISKYTKGQSAESYGLECAHSEGMVSGINEYLEVFDNLQFEIKEDAEEEGGKQ